MTCILERMRAQKLGARTQTLHACLPTEDAAYHNATSPNRHTLLTAAVVLAISQFLWRNAGQPTEQSARIDAGHLRH